jgi:hypothetical protein
MNTYTMPAEALNLPTKLAEMFKGKKVELIAQQDSVVIKSIDYDDIIEKTCGMFRSDGRAVDRFLDECQKEIDLEEEQHKSRVAVSGA